MNSFQIEPFLQNLSFSALFLTLLFFWVQASFSSGIIEEESNFVSFGTIGFFVASISLSLLLTLRWITNGYFPLSNLYESLMFLSWSFTILHIILEKIILVPIQTKQNKYFIGVITAPMALFTNAFATFSLPAEMQKANSLVPALQSNWLMMHVTVMMLSYATLLLGCVLSIAFLVLTNFQSKLLSDQKILTPLLESFEKKEKFEFFNSYYSTLTINIDNLSYRILGVGFPLLTLGILSGAVWANETWGSYWSWDPKETWALITWLIFASYFHVRITKGWKGEKPAILASAGFLIIWICYLGVNLLGKGLHSYGWINS